MKYRVGVLLLSTLFAFGIPGLRTHAQITQDVPAGNPVAVVNLATPEGVQLVQGEWRYHDAQIIETDFRNPGPDRKPSGSPNRTYDITPQAGAANFDDTRWDAIAPETLDQRRC
jgi:gluconolactonase